MAKAKNEIEKSLEKLIGQKVVIDTDSCYLYLGELISADAHFLCIGDVDVHESKQESLSKEGYVHESHSIGLRANRKETYVNMNRVVSISKLSDIVEF